MQFHHKGLQDYDPCLRAMEATVDAIRQGTEGDQVWLLEHPPLYTGGTSAAAQDLLEGNRFPVYQTGRGGEYTYHGPGQRVAYVMINLRRMMGGTPDVKAYIRFLEEWIIQTLLIFGVKGERRDGRVGIWVVKPDGREAKIAAIGVRIRHWITFHGISLNVSPDLSHYNGIIPCGISQYGVTSLQDLGIDTDMRAVDQALETSFVSVYDSFMKDTVLKRQ